MPRRGRVPIFTAPPCPADPAHGPLLTWDGGRWHCPHSDHTSKTPTKNFFTDEELRGDTK